MDAQQAKMGDTKNGTEERANAQPPLTSSPAEEVSTLMATPDSTPGRAPAFQFYPNDFLSDPNVIAMSLAERGAYITLICLCWQNPLPSDTSRLARLCGVSAAAFGRLWPALEICFRRDPESRSRLIHPRLERERAKQDEYRRRQSDNGRHGGRPRKPTPNPEKPTALSGLSQTEPKSNPEKALHLLSSSSSSSSDFSQRERGRVNGENPARNALALRAVGFIERYKAAHVKWRKGALYVGKSENLELQEAMPLVENYDDARLDKLTELWLRTEVEGGDAFLDSGTRTIAKFRSRVSKVDERLREIGQ